MLTIASYTKMLMNQVKTGRHLNVHQAFDPIYCVLFQGLDKHIHIYLRINLCPPYDIISHYQTG